MATDLAPVTPEVLRWARESIGVSLELAAQRANVSVERVTAWEEGSAEPTVAKLRELSKLYQRPLAVFFLPEPPEAYDTMRDFRRLPSKTNHAWSRSLHKVYRRALEQQDVAAELLEDEGAPAPANRLPAIALDTNPEEAGQIARERLGVALDQQFR